MAEFEDLALMKVMAAGGRGFIAMPTTALADAVLRYQFQSVGEAAGCRVEFYAIVAERRLAHPAVQAVTRSAPMVPAPAGKGGPR